MNESLKNNLDYLGLTTIKKVFDNYAADAAKQTVSSTDFFSQLIEVEVNTRRERAINRKIKHAHFPVIKTIDEYDWSAPDSINQELVRFLFNLDFIEKKENVALIGPPGTGKTHLMTSLAFHACKCGHSVLFAQAIDIINTLDEAQKNGTYSDAMKSFVSPEILCVDEIGFLPISSHGADLFFQVISARYETGSILLTSNLAFQDWTPVFAGNAALTSAILDRVLHHCHTIVIEGKSYRVKES